MLHLIFHIGEARFALPARAINEVLPLVAIKPAVQAPAGVAGFLNYRGQAVPVIDLTLLSLGRPALPRISTRIWIVDCPSTSADQAPRGIALIVEHATETAVLDPAAFRTPGLSLSSARHLGAIATDSTGMVQCLDLHGLLGPRMLAALFPREEADAVA
jgi:chemotaxis-related protein WspB